MKNINDFINESIDSPANKMTFGDLIELLNNVGIHTKYPDAKKYIRKYNKNSIIAGTDFDAYNYFDMLIDDPRNREGHQDYTGIIFSYLSGDIGFNELIEALQHILYKRKIREEY